MGVFEGSLPFSEYCTLYSLSNIFYMSALAVFQVLLEALILLGLLGLEHTFCFSHRHSLQHDSRCYLSPQHGTKCYLSLRKVTDDKLRMLT